MDSFFIIIYINIHRSIHSIKKRDKQRRDRDDYQIHTRILDCTSLTEAKPNRKKNPNKPIFVMPYGAVVSVHAFPYSYS